MEACHSANPPSQADADRACWEEAYQRFETPQQEIRKFVKRLKQLGATNWSRESEIVELFCGRGNGMHALERLGFTRVEGVDLSPALLAQYEGSAKCHTADCRSLPFDDGSKDILIVQGGLHHLLELPEDLIQTLDEVRRVLRGDGLFVIVEPWETPFLRFVHAVCDNRLARGLWDKLDALATMTRYELQTYEQWLSRPDEILGLLRDRFEIQQCRIGWGKLKCVARAHAKCATKTTSTE